MTERHSGSATVARSEDAGRVTIASPAVSKACKTLGMTPRNVNAKELKRESG